MGQSQSIPETPKKDKRKLNPPAEWRNDVDFQVVSPMSDISNPSQFRGRHFNQGNSTVRRNRTSKVCPKQRPPSGLPAPERFYFQGANEEKEDKPAEDKNAENSNWVGTMKTKCSRAKQQLTECIFQKDDEPLEVIEAEIKKRKQELKQERHSHDPYMQFDPLIKDQRERCMSEDVYLKEFPSKGNHLAKEGANGRITTTDLGSSNSSIHGRKLSLSSSKQTNSESSESSNSGRRGSDSTTKYEPAKKKTSKKEVFRPTHETKQAEILRQPSHDSLPLRASIRRSHSMDTRDQHRLSVEEKVQRQIDRHAQSRVQRLRLHHQDELEKLSNSAKKSRDRYAVAKRSGSVPRRKSVEVEVCKPVGSKESELKTAPKRSVSAPRPSIDGSALLHLTGWKADTTDSVQALPALLKIAGWKEQEPAQQQSKPGHHGQKPTKGDANKKPSAKATLHEDRETSRRLHGATKPSEKLLESKELAKVTDKQNVQQGEDTIKKTESLDALKQHSRPKSAAQKPSRHSDPLPSAGSGGNSIAEILQQAYFRDLDGVDSRAKNPANLMVNSDYRLVAYPGLALSKEMGPASIADRESPAHLVSNQASNNADFLFLSDANEVLTAPSRKPSSGDGINATASRHRTNIQPKQTAVVIPPPSSITSAKQERKVRFSSGSYPGIDHKLSDLTEDTALESSVAMSIPRIDSIPEEEEDDSVSPIPGDMKSDDQVPPVKELAEEVEEESTNFQEGGLAATSDSSPQAYANEDDEDEETPNQPPVTRWSYRHGDNLVNGVTPLIGGNKGLSAHTTNSPYLRFKEAKDRFDAGEVEPQEECPADTERSTTARRTTSLVSLRIAAMEAFAGEKKPDIPKKIRRATTGRDALAPRHGRLISPAMEYTNMNKDGDRTNDKLEDSTTTAEKSENTPITSVVSFDSDDEFGRILHPSAIDESSGSEGKERSSSDSSDDEFDNLLCENEEEEDDEDVSTVQPSVSTVQARFSMGSATTVTTENGSVATVLQRRRLLDSMSFGSEGGSVVSSHLSTYSTGDTASIPSMLKDENAIPSAVQRMGMGRLPFREAGPVKPNETSNGTPFQARKWRALAAAASEKSLSVRNVNQG